MDDWLDGYYENRAILEGTLTITGDAVMSSSSITAFDSTGFSDGDAIFFSGRDTANDGGGGWFTFSAGSVATVDGGIVFAPTGGGRLLRDGYTVFGFNGTVNVKWFGAKGGGTIVDTAAFTLAVSYLNTHGGKCELGFDSYLVDAGTIDLSFPGAELIGEGKGNCANLSPATDAPTTIIIKGIGSGLRARSQSIKFKDFRLTSDTTRKALAFDITSPGLRIEADDTASGRADRCVLHDMRIDNQPGDGVLTVGPVVYFDPDRVDIYECKGFGMRLEPGSLAGLIRTNPGYPGLSDIKSVRIGYCGGHAIAVSNPSVITQAQMGIRISLNNIDSFGNGQNTSIMYASDDGIFYDFWIFGENCSVNKSAPCGRVGLTLVPELIGGIWIAGRDNSINQPRFIDTKQPVYWGHVDAQPSTGLEINQPRIINATLTHTDAIKIQSASSKGLRVSYDRIESFVNVATNLVGTPTSQIIEYQGTHRHLNSIFTTGTNITIADDSVNVIEFNGQASILTYGVLSIACSAASSGGGIFHIRVGATSPLATKWAGEANTVAFAGGGALTGTTGIDGNLTVSTDGTKLYIENRRGFSVALNIHLSSMPTETGIVVS